MKTENSNSFSKDSLSNFESFYDDTKYEWYVAKHRKPSPAGLGLVNGLPIECCPHCEELISRNQVTTETEPGNTVALTAAKRSPH